MIEHIDSKLKNWGNFMRDGDSGLGYPKASVDAKMQDGCFGDSSGVPNDGFVPDEIMKTEIAVLKLPHELQATVNVCYTTRGNREFQAKTLSRRLKMRVSRDRLNKLLDHSHVRLAGFYDGRDW